MNSNDLLAQIAGITETDQNLPQNDLLCEEVNYEDMEEPIYDSVEEAEEEVQHTRNTRLYKRELRGLTFVNPGGEMSKMLPDSADIVSTSRSRRAHQQQAVEAKEPKDAVLHHDKLGRLTSIVKGSATVHDPCDCLREKCNGCNWPCRTCK
uniref:ARF7EP_C domain-containing protein n=1 Tax=Caenorhabditis japonica TaxID=281687 RepID=A0A8R1IHP3_CAEJA